MSEGQAYLEEKGFVPICDSEYIEILSLFEKSAFELNLWDELNCAYSCTSLEKPLEKNGKFTSLKVQIDHLDIDQVKDKQFVFSFTSNSLEYFVKSTLTPSKEEHHFDVEFISEVYKINKKEIDRFEISNDVQALIFFKNKDLFESIDNLVYFNKKEGNLVEFLKDFQKNSFKDLFKNKGDLPDKLASEIMGFKVLDISKEELSFLVNDDEKELFEGAKNDFDMVLNLKGIRYDLKEGKVLFHTTFNPTQMKSVPMHRIGVTFQFNEKLNEIIGSIPMAPEGQKGFWNL
jgi:hypothetical protein